MSNPRLRVERSDDTGDVLAEIRRLVARGDGAPQPDRQAMVVTARVIGGEERQTSAAQSLALSVEVPMAPAVQAVRQQAGGTGAGAEAPGSAVQGAQEPGHAPSAPRDTPFRLNPEAMVPPAEPPSLSARLRPDPGLAGDRRMRPAAEQPFPPAEPGPIAAGDRAAPARPRAKVSPWESDPRPSSLAVPEAKAPALSPAAFPLDAPPSPALADPAQVRPGQGHAAPAQNLPAQAGPRQASPTQAGPGPASAAPVPDRAAAGTLFPATPIPLQQSAAVPEITDPHSPVSLDREPAMQAYANSPVSQLHADSAMHFPERPAPLAPEALLGDEENPLRALLREVVREEFEGELKRNLDDNLRRMVRAEIAAALTEALMRRPRG